MPTPKTSHPIGITVYGIDRNNVLSEATVTITLTSGETTSGTTDSNGQVTLDLANAGSWNVGDSVFIIANKTGSGTKTQSLTLTDSPQQLTMYLAETSDLRYAETEDQHVLNFVLPVTYDGEKVTTSNPIPVKVVGSNDSIDLTNNPSHAWTITRDDLQPDSETVTLSNGDIYKRNFTYNASGAMTARSSWIKQ